MTAKTLERNKKITAYLQSRHTEALDEKHTTQNDKYQELLTSVFNSDTESYREIVLVALVGRMLNDSFRASTGFYDCHPRGIYDNGPIKDFLAENGFPHTKSGPLNIAKAEKNINDQWASGRSDCENATNVVELIKLIDSGSGKLRDDICVDLLRLYIKSAEKIQELRVTIEPSSDPLYLSNLCCQMISLAPNGGNTPQRIVGYLLREYHAAANPGIVVDGVEDSASATNTTSNKPGDIVEKQSDDEIIKVYEISVKKFDRRRIIDSYSSIVDYNKKFSKDIKEIIVVCRKEDCPPNIEYPGTKMIFGIYEYQDVRYYFLNIYEWIPLLLIQMTPSSRRSFHSRLNDYIDHPDTDEKVKRTWNNLHAKEAE